MKSGSGKSTGGDRSEGESEVEKEVKGEETMS